MSLFEIPAPRVVAYRPPRGAGIFFAVEFA